MRVVIADDSALIRAGLAAMLAEGGIEVVAEAATGEELLARVAEHDPDAALVDIRMPPTHTSEGLDAVARIRTNHSRTAALVLSHYVEPSYALRLIREHPGKVGYLLKERVGRADQLLDALRRLVAGECVIDRQIIDELMDRPRPVSADPLLTLTAREKEILALIAEGRSNHGICGELWLSPKTVETHIRNIFDKLNIPAAAEDNRRVLAVLTALQGRSN